MNESSIVSILVIFMIIQNENSLSSKETRRFLKTEVCLYYVLDHFHGLFGMKPSFYSEEHSGSKKQSNLPS